MTGQGLNDYVFEKLDEYTTPNITPLRMSDFLNKAYDTYFDVNFPKYEEDEWVRQAFVPLKRTLNPIPALVINQTLVDQFRWMTGLVGWFKNPCGNEIKPRNIRPVKDATIGTVLTDSFAQPDNVYPRYQITNNGSATILQILADTAPTKIDFYYLKKPNKIDLVGVPTAVLELEDFYMKKVGDLCVTQIMATFGDPRFATQGEVMSLEKQ